MNTLSPWVLITAIACIAAVAAVWWAWFKVFNSPAGEQYQKLRAQGPFVPVNENEQAKAK